MVVAWDEDGLRELKALDGTVAYVKTAGVFYIYTDNEWVPAIKVKPKDESNETVRD